jgi:hypothetical protein
VDKFVTRANSPFIWEEMTIPIPYRADRARAEVASATYEITGVPTLRVQNMTAA